MIRKLFGLFSMNNRTSRVLNNILISGSVKVISIFISLITISLTLKNLKTEEYGVWLTIYSIISWLMYFDGGLSSGLKNKFTEAKVKDEYEKLKSYVSTSYFILSVTILILIPIFYIINLFIDWNSALNISIKSTKSLNTTILIIFIIFCFHFVFRLIDSILIADQKSGKADVLNLVSSILSLIIFYCISVYFYVDLLITGIIFCGLPAFVNLTYSFLVFNSSYRYCVPSFKFVDLSYYKELMTLGSKFFVIQLCNLLTIGSTSFIISNALGPKDVVSYNLAYKYFSFTTILFSILTGSLYSSLNEAYQINDFEWIKRIIKKASYISYIIIGGIVIMFFLLDYVFKIWVGTDVLIESKFKLLIAVYFSMTILVSTYSTFISGIGKIKIAFYFSVINSILTIPISYFFAHKFGLAGLMGSLILLSAPGLYWLPMQYHKIINNSSFGLWDE